MASGEEVVDVAVVGATTANNDDDFVGVVDVAIVVVVVVVAVVVDVFASAIDVGAALVPLDHAALAPAAAKLPPAHSNRHNPNPSSPNVAPPPPSPLLVYSSRPLFFDTPGPAIRVVVLFGVYVDLQLRMCESHFAKFSDCMPLPPKVLCCCCALLCQIVRMGFREVDPQIHNMPIRWGCDSTTRGLNRDEKRRVVPGKPHPIDHIFRKVDSIGGN